MAKEISIMGVMLYYDTPVQSNDTTQAMVYTHLVVWTGWIFLILKAYTHFGWQYMSVSNNKAVVVAAEINESYS